MTEKERSEDEALKNCIQEAYGCSDDQLLAELDEIEASLSDSDFPGVEERIYGKLMERTEGNCSLTNDIFCDLSDAGNDVVIPIKVTDVNLKNIRLKKRILLSIILAATFVGAIGLSSIGGNAYFLKKRRDEKGIVLNSAKNVSNIGELEEAYNQVEAYLETPVLKMTYIPQSMFFEELVIINNKVTFVFGYEDKKVYFIQEKESKEISTGINSDRNEDGLRVYNKWISQNVLIEENKLSDKEVEYSSLIYIEEMKYRIIGILPKEEIEKIIENLTF